MTYLLISFLVFTVTNNVLWILISRHQSKKWQRSYLDLNDSWWNLQQERIQEDFKKEYQRKSGLE